MVDSEVQAGELAGVPKPVNAERAYYPALDGLRAVAFLLVFYQHYFNLPWGWSGVEIFFVLSGFLITGILYDTQDKPHRVRNFYLRRTLRIFPLYWGTLAAVFVAALFIHAKLDWNFAAWPLYFGNLLRLLRPAEVGSTWYMIALGDIGARENAAIMLHIGHFWSLCVEEQFYIFWPAVIFLVRRRTRLMWLCLAILILCPAARLLTQHLAPAWLLNQEVLYRFTPFRIDAFTYGALFALFRRGTRHPSLRRAAEIYLSIAGVLIVIFLGPHLLDDYFHRTYLYPSWEMTWGLILVDSVSLALVICALEPGSLVYRVLTTPALQWLGRISYGAYVFHFIFISLNDRFINYLPIKHKTLPVLTLPLVVTILLAWLSFRYFETPFIRLKNRFAS